MALAYRKAMRIALLLAFLLLAAALLAATLYPALDIAAAALFFDPTYQPVNTANHGFWLRENAIANAMHETIQWGARVLAALLIASVIFNKQRKAAVFLLVALIIGPGLLTNTVLKDNWGRARPVQVQEFGGTAQFTPALQPADQCARNCSFVSGDGALGFFLHAFFYVVPAVLRRRVFAAGFIGGSVIFGGLRIGMGAHFLSDVLWAGALMLVCTAIIHALLYGRAATKAAWRDLFAR